MSSSQPLAGKHRAAKARRAPQAASRAALKTSLTLSGMAVVATGFAVGSGALTLHPLHDVTSSAAAARVSDAAATSDAERTGDAGSTSGTGSVESTQAPLAGLDVTEEDRTQAVTRSDSRTKADPLKKDTLSLGGAGNTMSRTEDLSGEDPRLIAKALLASFGWSEDQFGCLDSLWTRESNWNIHADNPSSSAYGIPQALPGSKMASAGSDWATNAVTQIKWGLGYIQDRYGSPCGAWAHSESSGFY